MKTEDRYILGEFVLKELCCCPGSFERRLFLFGCVEPDYNIFSYARGSLKFSFFRGHNAENAEKHLSSLTARLRNGGVSNALRWFSLGAALHYIADSFTLVHNESFGKNLMRHRAYEKKLHTAFKRYISLGEFEKSRLFGKKYDFEKLRGEYRQCEHSVLSDCEYITCAALEFCAEVAVISKNYTVIKI